MAGKRGIELSFQTKEDIVKDYHDGKLSKLKLAKKYHCTYNTVDRVIDTCPYGFWDDLKVAHRELDAPVTETAKTVSELKAQVAETALRVVALTLQAMEETLENHRSSLNPGQLSQFMTAAAPYAVARVETKKKTDTRKDNPYKLFKENLNNLKKNAKVTPNQGN